MTSATGGSSVPTPSAKIAARAFGWNAVALAVLTLAQLGYTGATARILPASAFGAYAVCQAAVGIIGYLSMASLGSAVMRHPLGSDEAALAGTALAIAAVAGSLCGGLLILVAAPWAQAWNLPLATHVLRLAALLLVLGPVSSVLLGLLRRTMRYKAAAVIELVGSLIGFGGGLPLAFALRDARALIFGQIASLLVTILLAFGIHRPALRLGDIQLRRSLFRFSSQIGAQNLVYYVIYNAPSFTVSRLFGATVLGFYSRANLLVSLPLTQATQGLSRALYPLLGQKSDSGDRQRRAITDILVVASLPAFVFFTCVAAAATPVVGLLLGAGFAPAAEFLRLLALFGAINMVVTMAGVVQEVRGWMRDVWVVQCWKLCVLGVGLPLVAWWSRSVPSVLIVFCLSQAIGHIVQLHALSRRQVLDGRRLVRAYAQHGGIACIVYLSVGGTGLLWSTMWAQLATQAVAGLFLLAVLWRLRFRILGFVTLGDRDLIPTWARR
jgi:lipopolysaccharide exporter